MKQDKTFQAGAILASHSESVFLPSSGWLSQTEVCRGRAPPPPASHPGGRGRSVTAFLPGTFGQNAAARPSRLRDTRERSTLPGFYFIFQERKQCSVQPVWLLGNRSEPDGRAGDTDRWLRWSPRNVCVALISVPYPSFPTPGEKRPVSRVYCGSGAGVRACDTCGGLMVASSWPCDFEAPSRREA